MLSARVNMNRSFKYIAFSIFFVASWLGLSLASSVNGGWDQLADHYKTELSVSHHVENGSLRLNSENTVNYSNSGGVDIGFDKRGVFVSPSIMFSFRKPNLHFPWSSINRCIHKSGWTSFRVKNANILVSIKDSRKIIFDACSENLLRT